MLFTSVHHCMPFPLHVDSARAGAQYDQKLWTPQQLALLPRRQLRDRQRGRPRERICDGSHPHRLSAGFSVSGSVLRRRNHAMHRHGMNYYTEALRVTTKLLNARLDESEVAAMTVILLDMSSTLGVDRSIYASFSSKISLVRTESCRTAAVGRLPQSGQTLQRELQGFRAPT